MLVLSETAVNKKPAKAEKNFNLVKQVIKFSFAELEILEVVEVIRQKKKNSAVLFKTSVVREKALF